MNGGLGMLALALFVAVPFVRGGRRIVAATSLGLGLVHGGWATLEHTATSAWAVPAWRHGVLTLGLFVLLATWGRDREGRRVLALLALATVALHVGS